MNLRRFDWALKTRGADLDTWPEPDQARALLRHSANARALLADALAGEAPPAESGARVLHNLRRRLSARTPLQAGLRWGVLLACTVAGLLLGRWITEPSADALTMVQAAMVQAALAP